MSAPEVSIVIPIHDEEAILHAAVVDLRTRLEDADFDYEILLAENGSRDATRSIAEALAARYPEVRFFSCAEANYGAALREGIARARGSIVVCDEIDLCDADFHRRAVAMLRRGQTELVIGSKLIAGAQDRRPLFRHMASIVYTALLRVLLDFSGTDTHGLKAFRRAAVAPIADRCVVGGDVFASELVIRAYREGVVVEEIPVCLVEKRPPSIRLFERVPAVLKNLYRLRRALGS